MQNALETSYEASCGASCRGERRGGLERSNTHDNVPRASLPASSQRCHQRCAVAGDTLKAADERVAAGESELGVTGNDIRALLRGVSRGRPTHSKEGRIEPSTVHNVCRRDITSRQ
jgi:hypothetical protein